MKINVDRRKFNPKLKKLLWFFNRARREYRYACENYDKAEKNGWGVQSYAEANEHKSKKHSLYYDLKLSLELFVELGLLRHEIKVLDGRHYDYYSTDLKGDK